MSAPCQTLRPPSPSAFQRAERSAPSSAHHVRYTSAAGTAHTANLRTKRRTKPIGPSSASTSAQAPKTSVQSHCARKPKSLSDSAAAAVAITRSSKTVQPTPWSTLTPVGSSEPRRPSGARMSAMPGTRASAPIIPATASIAFPITPPTTMATSAEGSESACTSSAPATITSSDTPRFPQSRPVSTPPRTRSRGGTGSMPQLPSTISWLAIRRVSVVEDLVVIPRYYVVAEAEHELQNPTSKEKLLLLGHRLGLGPESRVLDIASGRGGPALLLAESFGCRIRGVEISTDFHAAAVERAAAAGLSELVAFELGDGAAVAFEPEEYDAALCLGASFVFGSLADTVDALAPAVRAGGYVVVGEPYWKTLDLPDDYAERHEPWTTLEGTVTIFETSGLPVVSLIASSEDDWDRYETLHWQSVERWLAENPDDPEASEIRSRYEASKRTHLRHRRGVLGWAIFVGWKPPG